MGKKLLRLIFGRKGGRGIGNEKKGRPRKRWIGDVKEESEKNMQRTRERRPWAEEIIVSSGSKTIFTKLYLRLLSRRNFRI